MTEPARKRADAEEAFGPETKEPSHLEYVDPEYTDIDTDDEDVADFEIEVLNDTPEEDQRPARNSQTEETLTDGEDVKEYSDSVQKRINKLRYDYHEERRMKEAAQRQGEEAVRYAQKVLEENRRLQDMASSSLLEKTDAELQTAEKEYREAYEDADTDKIVAAQRKISELHARRSMAQLYAPPQHVEGQQPVQHAQQPMPQQPDPRQLDPKAVAWLRSNPWFGQDREMTSFAFGLHEKLVAEEGVDPRTDVYFERINKRLREVFPDRFDGNPSEAEEGRETSITHEVAVTPQRTPVVAAPSRSGKPPRKVQLTATQVAVAKRLGLSPEQYAKQLIKEQASGG
jgi:hypothetical protein